MAGIRKWIRELMRRRVIPVAVYYVGIAWVILQIGDVAQETWGFPPLILQYIWIALGIGLPITLVLSWVYDITPQGIIETQPLRAVISGASGVDWVFSSVVEPEEASPGATTCPSCRKSNREGSRFCIHCGTALEKSCPACGVAQVSGVRNCSNCGFVFEISTQYSSDLSDGENTIRVDESIRICHQEKRHVCVVCVQIRAPSFSNSDVEEEARVDQLSEFIETVVDIANRYGGQIGTSSEQMIYVLFGLINAYEHDAISAVRTALEIGKLRDCDSTIVPKGVGIATGFVLTRPKLEGGHSSAPVGIAMRRASEISAMASDGEVLVASEVCDQATNFFEFEISRSSLKVDLGQEQPTYIALHEKEEITTVHRSTGRRSPLIGRDQELKTLNCAVERLEQGQGSVVTIVGAAGTGKSRLVEEFKSRLKPGLVQFYEGHAFSFARSTPYFPICDLLKKIWNIQQGDSREHVQTKFLAGASGLFGSHSSMIPYIAMLFGIDDERQKQDSPEVVNIRLKRALISLLSAISAIRPTVIFIEDLHWADSASVELIRFAIKEMHYPALLVCTSRPHFSLIDDSTQNTLGGTYHSIRLSDLSSSETAQMTGYLFDRNTIPEDFIEFVSHEAEGNPFYVEEIVNSALEAGILVCGEGGWKLTQALQDLKIPTTIFGVINERVQRLDVITRDVLEEAAVIGRMFSISLLQAISRHPESLIGSINQLEKLGMIRSNAAAVGGEYFFNHVMTQEVIYDGLLSKTRQIIHERIGRAAENLFADRLSENSDMLAFHFKRGKSREKAVRYLLIAAAKSWHRYSLDEAHSNYKEAYEILTQEQDPSQEGQQQLLQLLDQWAIVFNHRGDYMSLLDLLDKHERLADAMEEKNPMIAAMYFGWKGYALQCAESLDESYQYLQRALYLAEQCDSAKATAYVCAWLGRTATDMGKFDDALDFCDRAWTIASDLETDSKLFRFIWSALGLAHYFRGDRVEVEEVARFVREYAETNSDLRALLISYVNKGCAFLLAGDYHKATIEFQRGAGLAVDPMYVMYARLMCGVTLASAGKLTDAEKVLVQVIDYDQDHGFNLLGTTAKGMMSVVLLSRGDLAKGVAQAESVLESYRAHGNRFRYAHQHHMLGSFYLKLILKEGPSSFGFLAKNATFLLRNLRHARNKAEDHFQKAIELANAIGAKGVLGQSWLDLGRLYAAEVDQIRAAEAMEMAVEIFEHTGAEDFLTRAVREIDALEASQRLAASGG